MKEFHGSQGVYAPLRALLDGLRDDLSSRLMGAAHTGERKARRFFLKPKRKLAMTRSFRATQLRRLFASSILIAAATLALSGAASADDAVASAPQAAIELSAT